MTGTQWKVLEKLVAAQLQGYRLHRGGDFSESAPDVLAPMVPNLSTFGLDNIAPYHCSNTLIVVECKYRKVQPWINYYQEVIEENDLKVNPIIGLPYRHPITNEDTTLLCGEFRDILANLIKYEVVEQKRDIPGYIDGYYKQVCEQIYDNVLRQKFIFKYNILANANIDLRSKFVIPFVVMARANTKLRLGMIAVSDLKPLLEL